MTWTLSGGGQKDKRSRSQKPFTHRRHSPIASTSKRVGCVCDKHCKSFVKCRMRFVACSLGLAPSKTAIQGSHLSSTFGALFAVASCCSLCGAAFSYAAFAAASQIALTQGPKGLGTELFFILLPFSSNCTHCIHLQTHQVVSFKLQLIIKTT